MKAKSSIIGFAAIVFATAWTAPSPQVINDEVTANSNAGKVEDDFSFARLQIQRAGATATWGVAASTDIEGFIIQKTSGNPYDEDAWKDVSSIGNDGSRSFSYTDTKYSKGKISYRIVALKTDNSAMVSDILTPPGTRNK